ncbi:MAG TPA: DEAD/DEAH box helicase [Planctomycetaceae bacterium]|nr:DEAD/DEAH box helicase [Planctomycetaceae bacterium]
MRSGERLVRVRGLSWHPPEAPTVRRVALEVPVRPFITGFNRALGRGVPIRFRRLAWAGQPPRSVSVAIGSTTVRARTFLFAQPQGEEASSALAASHPRAAMPTQPGRAGAPDRATRIRPPRDIVKLEDRLHYLLQPPLEALFRNGLLGFPVRPFTYQLEGIAFLYPRHSAVLADEMGLGKTMQAITAIRLLLRLGEVHSVLVVCPKPLVANWRREFEHWAPEVPVVVIQGQPARRQWLWELAGVPVKIANYELLRRDWESWQSAGPAAPAIHFDLVVLDESQRIKNRASVSSQAVRSISRSRSWALTGTPVENSLEDLVGIFEFLAPGLLSPRMRPSAVGQTISDYVLRRTKDQVFDDLPPRLYRDAEVELVPEQRESYRRAEKDGVLRLSALGEGVTIQHVFELVLRLKQICNFDPATGASAKLERLEADLEEVAASGRKALVFSQWVETLRQLAVRLSRFGPLEYHGGVPPSRREEVLRRFRHSPEATVLLISYGAGGVGLNLQCASYVFLFDRWWNPAVEDQAISRAHRIGTAEAVTITRLLAVNTIEERIQRILEEKRELFEALFASAGSPTRTGLSQEEIFSLFDLAPPSATRQAA